MLGLIHISNKYLTVKDVLWCGLFKLDVPYKSNTIGFMRSIFIIVIGSNQQLRILQYRGREREVRMRDWREGCQ